MRTTCCTNSLLGTKITALCSRIPDRPPCRRRFALQNIVNEWRQIRERSTARFWLRPPLPQPDAISPKAAACTDVGRPKPRDAIRCNKTGT
jgi:hypothetical protein